MSNKRLNAVDKALHLLRVFRPGDRSVTLAELADRTGLNKSTILRIAASLERANLLVKLPVGGFRLGGQVLALAAIFREGMQLDDQVRPLLSSLAQETGESASMFLLEGENRFRVARVEPNQGVRDAASPLLLQPLKNDETATGLVLRRKVGRLVGQVKTPFAPVFTTGIKDIETASMSSPVLGGGGTLIGALTLSGPAFRLTAQVAEGHALAVAKMAGTLSKVFGYDEIMQAPLTQHPVAPKKGKGVAKRRPVPHRLDRSLSR
ncbi:MAG: helix-turn-helix domain-containing protein [Proteobacteria bacterium]|nr:helix-turn-helix domain-containing protein [Pseudomonadota bacterium]